MRGEVYQTKGYILRGYLAELAQRRVIDKVEAFFIELCAAIEAELGEPALRALSRWQ